MNLIDDHVGALLEALLQDILLLAIFVAATAGDEQDAQWFRCRDEMQWSRETQKGQRADRECKTTIGHVSVVHPRPMRHKPEHSIPGDQDCIPDPGSSLITGAPLFLLVVHIRSAAVAAGG